MILEEDHLKTALAYLIYRCNSCPFASIITKNNLSTILMNASFSKKFGFLCDKDVLEDRYWSLRKEYMDITDILNHNGFAWDGIRQTMTADDDVWEAYIKVLFFLICNVARIKCYLLLFPLVITKEH